MQKIIRLIKAVRIHTFPKKPNNFLKLRIFVLFEVLDVVEILANFLWERFAEVVGLWDKSEFFVVELVHPGFVFVAVVFEPLAAVEKEEKHPEKGLSVVFPGYGWR